VPRSDATDLVDLVDTSASPPDPRLGVQVDGLRRSFGAVHAVRRIDLHAAYGEVTALVGPNGAGKTTLLLVLATLLQPDGGRVLVAGHDPVLAPRAVRAATGWSPDVFGVPETLTATEYLVGAAAAHRLPRADRSARAAELLAQLGLEEYAGQPARVLSRGQKQRLGLARAMVHAPRVLLLDEPAAGLDPRARVALRDLLRSLATAGAAVVVSSHVLADLEDLADSVVVVDGGVTVAAHQLDALPVSRTPRTWRVRALDAALLTAALARGGVAHTLVGSGAVELPLANDQAAADLLARLVSERVPVVSLAPTGGVLEAAYLDATGDATGDSA